VVKCRIHFARVFCFETAEKKERNMKTQFSGEDTQKTGIFCASELEKLRSRAHTAGQLWLMDDLLRRIIAFMPEKQDYHCEWHDGGVYYGALEWMLRFRPQYQADFFTKKERICLEYLFLERLHRFVLAVNEPLHWHPAGDRIQSVDVKALQQWALSQRKHLPAWTAWLAAVWYGRGRELWVYRDFDWMELDPRPLVKRIREKRGTPWCKIYDQNCPDEYRV